VFRQHLLKALFDKIKTDHRKWLFVAEKPNIQVIFNLFEIISLNQRSKRFVKTFINDSPKKVKRHRVKRQRVKRQRVKSATKGQTTKGQNGKNSF